MARFLLRRLGAAAALLGVVLTATFFLIHLAPGDPSNLFLDPRLGAEGLERLRQVYGFDDPLPVQYGRWLKSALSGDLGVSITHGRDTVAVLLERFPSTLLLVLGALLVEYGLGFALGATAAVRAGGTIDRQIRLLSLVLFAMPSFWLAILLIDFFAVRGGLFPVGQMSSHGVDALPFGARILDLLHHLALALGLARCGAVARYLRSGLLDVLGEDYIRTARAMGLGRWRVLFVHAMKNAVGPLVQRFGVSLPGLLSGTVLIELIFSWPGLGQLTYTAVLERDYPLVLAATLMSGIFVVVATFVTDLLHAAVDPRVRVHAD